MKFRTIRYFDPNDGRDRHSFTMTQDRRTPWQLHVTISLTDKQYEAIHNRETNLDVTIEPVQTREERLREVRLSSVRQLLLVYYEARILNDVPKELVDVIERVDAEFAKGEE